MVDPRVMRKVQSAPNLSSLDKGASNTPKHLFNNNAPLAFKARAPGKPHHTATTTKAMMADHSYTAPVPNTAVEIFYAITSRGILSTTECLPIEMEMIAEAPSLQDQDEDGDGQSLFTTNNNTSAAHHHPPPHRHSSGEMEMAACLAAPALPDRSNAEIVATKAARMASTAEAQVRVRYAVEVAGSGRRIGSGGSGGIGGNGTFLRRSLLNRKRSLDDLDLLHLETFELLDKAAFDAAATAVAAGVGVGVGGGGIAGLSGLGGGGGQLPSSASSPETKRLLTSRYHHGLIEDASGSGNRLHVEEVPTVTPSHESLASIEIFMDAHVEMERQQQQQQENEEEDGRMQEAVVPLPSPGRQQEQNNKQPWVLKDAKNVMEKNHVVPFTLGKKKMNTDNAAAGKVI